MVDEIKDISIDVEVCNRVVVVANTVDKGVRALAGDVADGKNINLAARNLLLLQKRKQGTRFVRGARHGQRSELQRTLRSEL